MFPGSAARLLVDVTVRSPHAARYKDAARVIGSAAEAGAAEKVALYGPEVSAPYLAGSFAGALYFILLGKKTDSITQGRFFL